MKVDGDVKENEGVYMHQQLSKISHRVAFYPPYPSRALVAYARLHLFPSMKA